MSTLEERIQRMEDDSAIRELVARFAYTTTNADHDAFSKLWVSQGDSQPIWTLSDPFQMSATGIHEIVDMIRKLRDTRDFFVQMVHTGVLDIKGDRATGRWILHEVAKGPGEVVGYSTLRNRLSALQFSKFSFFKAILRELPSTCRFYSLTTPV
jgi:hypothetical protein